jgi:chlorobactene glucosyltransferase
MDSGYTMLLNLSLGAIMLAIFGGWVYFLRFILKSLRASPTLETITNAKTNRIPKVSVIVTALNEEKYIARCLDSLLKQDYPNFEVIAVNDSSKDRTGEIMKSYAMDHSNVAIIHTRSIPKGWVGKNWACYQGYLRSTGDIFLFTDADTVHSAHLMKMGVISLGRQKLDALTVIPRLLCNDIWTKVTLPVLSIFLNTRFSPLRVNDPKTKTGYFFGSFFLISRETYEKVGTHEGVREELIEDGALGNKVKLAGFKLKMFRGECYIEAIWARDLKTLWHGLRRLMIPMYVRAKSKTLLLIFAVFFLLFEPFILIPYSLSLFSNPISDQVTIILPSANIATVLLMLFTNVVQLKLSPHQNAIYALGLPLGGAIVSLSFISSVIGAKKKNAVNWRDRRYTISGSGYQQS